MNMQAVVKEHTGDWCPSRAKAGPAACLYEDWDEQRLQARSAPVKSRVLVIIKRWFIVLTLWHTH